MRDDANHYLSGAPLLPAFVLRQPDGRFVGGFGAAIVVDTGTADRRKRQLSTQTFATQLEARIRATPHLWYLLSIPDYW